MLKYVTTVCLMALSIQAFDKGNEFNSPLGRRMCRDMSASYPDLEPQHGDPQGTDPNAFANITVIRESDNLWNITVRMHDNIVETSLGGWIVQVRPYGRGDLFDTYPVGVIESAETTSDYWFCEDSAGASNFTRNGVVHANGAANGLVNLRSFSFTWASIPGLYPECARVVATLMGVNGLWFHIMESDCFMSVTEDGEIGRCEFPQCDPRDPGQPPIPPKTARYH